MPTRDAATDAAVDASSDGGRDGGGDGGGDSGPEDMGPDMPTVSCTAEEWFCDEAGTGAHYCNAAGDGVLSSVHCNGRACSEGFCEPLPYIEGTCATLLNGQRGDLVGGEPCFPGFDDWSYLIWLDRGDTLEVVAEAIAPLVRAVVTIRGDEGPEETRSEPGGSVTVTRVAVRAETLRVALNMVRETGTPTDIDGARLRYAIVRRPPATPPAPLPSVCTAASDTCADALTLSYCAEDGSQLRTHDCGDAGEAGECRGDACVPPRGERCSDAVPVERPTTDSLTLDAMLSGVNNDLDPGTACLDVGMSGGDRVFRLNLEEGDRIRISTNTTASDLPNTSTHGLYLLSDCSAPTTSCLAGSLGYQLYVREPVVGRRDVEASLDYTAPRAETVFVVLDLARELGGDFLPGRVIRFDWFGSCADGVRNGDETGIDCGGPCSTGCPDGDRCLVDSDCHSRRCNGIRCTRPAGCGDGVAGFGEECDDGNAVDDDACGDGCRIARCDDDVRNRDETAVDVGGYCSQPDGCTCARPEVIEPFVVDDPTHPVPFYRDQLLTVDLTVATDDFAPSCAASSSLGDRAYRITVHERARVGVEAYNGVIGSELTVAMIRDCDATTELACASENGPRALGVTSLALELDPGFYTAWVETGDPAAVSVRFFGEQL